MDYIIEKLFEIEEWFEIRFWKLGIWLIVKGYGPKCESSDLEDFPELKKNHEARCGCCKAWETVDWIENHIKILEY
jgi:hypothetical protein